EKYPSDDLMMKLVQKGQLKQLIKQHGEEEGRRQYELINRAYFTVGLQNTDPVRKAVRVELMIDYQACNAGHCRPPNQLTLHGRIPVAGTMQPGQNINRDLFPAH
ncbi:MAG: hypothetical protein ABGZ17_24120, partial [Planctomycetaceae bacterium]